MATKAQSIHPSYHGVCGRHGAEEHGVTPGDLIGCSTCQERRAKGCLEAHEAKWRPRSGEKSEDGAVPEARARQAARPRKGREEDPGKAVRAGARSAAGGQRVSRG